jgi:hypothetical protein
LVDTRGFWARNTRKGKHRTEVTEVTEGEGAVAVGTYASPYADPPTRFSPPGLFGGHRGFRALRTATLVKRQPWQIEN